MEDPITFDLWVGVPASARVHAEELLRRVNPDIGTLKAKQSVAKAVATGEPFLFMHRASWLDADALRTELRRTSLNVQAYQAGYGPANLSSLAFCEIHQLHYAGVLGCPVCGGRNA